MGFFERLSRLFRANLNDMVSRAEDPAKILDQSVMDMQSDLVKLRTAVATAVASQKRIQRQASQAEDQAKHWYGRAQQALQGGDEGLAREALSRRKTCQETALALSNQLQSQTGQVQTLKQSLMKLEGKIAEAKTKKDMLKARAQAAKAQQQLQSAVGGISTDSASAAFERMEEKVDGLEAASAASAELAGSDLESRIEALQGDSVVDSELAALKAEMGAEPLALPDTRDASSSQGSRPVTHIDVEPLALPNINESTRVKRLQQREVEPRSLPGTDRRLQRLQPTQQKAMDDEMENLRRSLN